MSKKKYYVVKKGFAPGIYDNWTECEKQVKGYRGQLYKSFTNHEDAKKFFEEATSPIEEALSQNPGGVHYDIYTDGAYGNGRYSWAFASYKDNELVHTEAALGRKLWALTTRNIVGELDAVMFAVLWAESQGATSITIHHDLEGVSRWASGTYRAKIDITKAFVEFIRPRLCWVNFNKVKAHSKIDGNELADNLAKEALLGANNDSKEESVCVG